MTTAGQIEKALFRWAPQELAEEWDNVGLLVGGERREVSRVLVALDVTPEVVAEAAGKGAQLIVAHHPVMNVRWHEHELKTLREDTRLGRLLLDLAARGLSVICMHTNLDAAQGGVNDLLARALDLEALEVLDEKSGVGRVGILPQPLSLEAFLERIDHALRPNGIRYVDGGGGLLQKVAVGGGACGEFFKEAAARQCGAFVTADVSYDQFLDAKAMGLTLIDAGHFPTEDLVCPEVVRYLQEAFPDLAVEKSSSHGEVVQYYSKEK